MNLGGGCYCRSGCCLQPWRAVDLRLAANACWPVIGGNYDRKRKGPNAMGSVGGAGGGIRTPPCAADPGAGARRRGWSGQLLVNECGELGLAHGSHLGGGELAVLEEHERGDSADAELGRNFTVFIHVHLGDL